MKRRHVERAVLFAIAFAARGCHSFTDLPSSEGSVDISLINTTHLSFQRVDYQVSGNGIEEITGSISLSDPAATPSALVGGLPEAQGYLLELTATSDDETGFCYGAATFDVMKGHSTPVAITLVCTTAHKVRTKIVNGMTDYCPSLASYAASPPEAPVGGTISLSATAFSFYSDPLMFSWRAMSGGLSSTTTAVATYTCAEAGTHVLTVEVTDGICPDTATLTVTCVAPPNG